MTWLEKLIIDCQVEVIPASKVLRAKEIQFMITDRVPILCTNINKPKEVSYLIVTTKDHLAEFMTHQVDEIFTKGDTYIYTLPEVVKILKLSSTDISSLYQMLIDTNKISNKFQQIMMYDSLILNMYLYINTRNFQNLRTKQAGDRIASLLDM
jgi:hypothetical protein